MTVAEVIPWQTYVALLRLAADARKTELQQIRAPAQTQRQALNAGVPPAVFCEPIHDSGRFPKLA